MKNIQELPLGRRFARLKKHLEKDIGNVFFKDLVLNDVIPYTSQSEIGEYLAVKIPVTHLNCFFSKKNDSGDIPLVVTFEWLKPHDLIVLPDDLIKIFVCVYSISQKEYITVYAKSFFMRGEDKTIESANINSKIVKPQDFNSLGDSFLNKACDFLWDRSNTYKFIKDITDEI